MRMAIVTPEGKVANIIEADAEFDPGAGLLMIPAQGAVSPGWTWDGNRFAAPEPEQSVPEKVTDLQFRLALSMLGLRDAAEKIVEDGSPDIRDYWDRAVAIHRGHPFVVQAARALKKSEAEIDDLFRLAAGL